MSRILVLKRYSGGNVWFQTYHEKQLVSQKCSGPRHATVHSAGGPRKPFSHWARTAGPGVSSAARTGQVWAKLGPLSTLLGNKITCEIG